MCILSKTPRKLLGAILSNQAIIVRLLMTLQERFDAVDKRLDEASTEILALIQSLKDQLANGTLTPEAEASLEALETKAASLADIVPDAPVQG